MAVLNKRQWVAKLQHLQQTKDKSGMVALIEKYKNLFPYDEASDALGKHNGYAEWFVKNYLERMAAKPVKAKKLPLFS